MESCVDQIKKMEKRQERQEELISLLLDYVQTITPFYPSTYNEKCKETDELQRQIREIEDKYNSD